MGLTKYLNKETGKDLLKAGRNALAIGGLIYLVKEAGNPETYGGIRDSILTAKAAGILTLFPSFGMKFLERYFPNWGSEECHFHGP